MEWASVARGYRKAVDLPEAEGSSRARRHVTPTLQLLHYLVLLYLPLCFTSFPTP